jgi:hypothetical protein
VVLSVPSFKIFCKPVKVIFRPLTCDKGSILTSSLFLTLAIAKY